MGFARYVRDAEDLGMPDLAPSAGRAFETTLGCPLRVVHSHD